MERVLEYEKYRNLGLKNKERLVLNKSLEKGKMGNLVIVVGANNSGKSNVLDGLLAFDVVVLLAIQNNLRPSKCSLNVFAMCKYRLH